MGDDLIAWLRAQLDDDERMARAATAGPWRPGTTWFEEAVFAGPAGEAATCVAGTGDSDAEHIAEHDPARVLAEVEAKRQIIDVHEPELEMVWSVAADAVVETGALGCGNCGANIGQQPWPCQTLRLLALPYADRSGYRAEWSPE